MIRFSTLCLSTILLPLSLLAKPVEIKGKNGKIIHFELLEVAPEGILASLAGAPQAITLAWDNLDTRWVMNTHPEINEIRKAWAATGDSWLWGPFTAKTSRNEAMSILRSIQAEKLDAPYLPQRTYTGEQWYTVPNIYPGTEPVEAGFYFDIDDNLTSVNILGTLHELEAWTDYETLMWKIFSNLGSMRGLPEIQQNAFPPKQLIRSAWENQPTGRRSIYFDTHIWENDSVRLTLGIMSTRLAATSEEVAFLEDGENTKIKIAMFRRVSKKL